VPKGALITHKNMMSEVANVCDTDITTTSEDVLLSYLPLAHIAEQLINFVSLCNGSAIGFYCGDISKIGEDLAKLRPTIFLSVPRLWNRFYDRMQG